MDVLGTSARVARFFCLGLVALSLLVADAAAAAELTGKVVGVADGDTVTVLDAEKQKHRIRLGGIDAPERRQPFSQRSKQALSDLVYGREVVVRWEKRDRYGRIVGSVWVADPRCVEACPKSVDAGLSLVSSGLAWWYRYYAKEQAPGEAKRYEAAEAAARAAGAGIWSEKNPTAPWDFRKQKRSKRR